MLWLLSMLLLGMLGVAVVTNGNKDLLKTSFPSMLFSSCNSYLK